jgi:hypothetical protein
MDETEVTSPKGSRSKFRLLISLGVGTTCAILAVALGYGQAGTGIFIGALLSAFYMHSFLGSHIERTSRDKFVDASLVGGATFRFLLVGVVGAALLILGKEAVVGYLIGFGMVFGVLLATEGPKVARDFRARGLLG